MRPLIDAHTLIWALEDPSQLGPQAIVPWWKAYRLSAPTHGLMPTA